MSLMTSILGWTLVHSLWQAGLVACALVLVLRLIPEAMTRLRTALASGGLVLVAGFAVVVWLGLAADWRQHEVCWRTSIYADAHPALCASHGIAPPADVVVDKSSKQRAVLAWAGSLASGIDAPVIRRAALALTASRAPALIVILCSLVAVAALLRLLRDVYLLRRLVRRSRSLEDARVLRLLDRRREATGVLRPVSVRESSEVSSPSVAGWRFPVILLPPGMAPALKPEEIDCVLAHELVHVRRRHFALNLVQRALECLFAWNPFVLWISRRVRDEREALCDAAAAGPPDAVTDRRRYAETLLRLERLRIPARAASIGLLGEGPLLRRVRRLTDTAVPRRAVRARRAWAAGVSALTVLLLLGQLSLRSMAISSWAAMEHDIAIREQAVSSSEEHRTVRKG